MKIFCEAQYIYLKSISIMCLNLYIELSLSLYVLCILFTSSFLKHVLVMTLQLGLMFSNYAADSQAGAKSLKEFSQLDNANYFFGKIFIVFILAFIVFVVIIETRSLASLQHSRHFMEQGDLLSWWFFKTFSSLKIVFEIFLF